ncbi:DUF5704 domain-containing protein [Fusibacter sp. A1]|uniref:DUF5704 domain-containing protein n=2 Tax=unclassified Fusibacter TaxID=2624464 RepID=UPI00352FA1DE
MFGTCKYSNLTNISEYRYLGKSIDNQNIPNYNYSYDMKSSIDFSEMNWIYSPYNSLIITSDSRFDWVFNNTFNRYRDSLLLNSFLAGMHEQHGNPLRPTGDHFDETKDVPWQEIFHVVTPPTKTTYGLAMLWHISDLDGKLYYIDVALQPFNKLRGNIIIEYKDMTTGALVYPSETRLVDDGQSLSITAIDIPGFNYKGAGVDYIANPTITTVSKSVDVHYAYEYKKQTLYVTFYLEKDTASPNADLSGSIEISSDTFDASRAIPTGELVTISATIDTPTVFNYTSVLNTGVESYNVEVVKPYTLKWNEKTRHTSYHTSPCADTNGDSVVDDADDPCGGHTTTSNDPQSENGVERQTYSVDRSYSYYTIYELNHFELDLVNVYNPKLSYLDPVLLRASALGFVPEDIEVLQQTGYINRPDALGTNAAWNASLNKYIVTLPKSTYRRSSKPSFDFFDEADSAVGKIKVRNDRILVNGIHVLNDDWHLGSTPLPAPIPKLRSAVLTLKDYLISHRIFNGYGETTGFIEYTFKRQINSTLPLPSVAVTGNPLNIHTPVVCDVSANPEDDYDQRSDLSGGRVNVPLDYVMTVNFDTENWHIANKGYGYRDYGIYSKYKRISFPFDVYVSSNKNELIGTPDTLFYLKKNNWHVVPISENAVYFKVPHWCDEGDYVINTQVVSLNHRSPSGYELRANLDFGNDIAAQQIPIVVSGRIFDFVVTGVSDKRWLNQFSDLSTYFTVGSNNKNGRLSNRSIGAGGAWPYTLPIAPGKNTDTGLEDASVKLGYPVQFALKTIGDYFGIDDLIILRPEFYRVDQNGLNREPVDLYYLTGQQYVKVGSVHDQLKHRISLNGLARKVSATELIRTADTIKALGESITGLTKEAYLKSTLDTTYVCKPKTIVLSKALRTFIGSYANLPAGVDKHRAIAGVQMWYGEYLLPNSAIVVPKGADLFAGYRDNTTSIFEDGFLIVHMKIDAVKDMKVTDPKLSYVTDTANEWLIEGYDTSSLTYEAVAGDVILYEIDKHASDDLVSE